MTNILKIPELSLVVLIGVTGSGKSTFARRCFAPTQVLASDAFRAMVSDDENDQGATSDAFAALDFVAGRRLAAGRLTVVDATNVQPTARRSLIALAREHDVLPVAVVLDVPEAICRQRTAARSDRPFGEAVVRRQADQLRRSIKGLVREGFRVVHHLTSVQEIDAAQVVTTPMLTDRRELAGPFDIIGDVHGCLDELTRLLDELGYRLRTDEQGKPVDGEPPAGRTAVFLGDLVDRGPDSPGALRLVMGMCAAGHALAVPGNHEAKLVNALRGRKVTISHGLAETLSQLADEDDAFRDQVAEFCYGLVSHLVLDGGKLVVAHAGMKQAYQGRASGRVRAFALYGETTGETDEFGLPVRHPWAQEYRGPAVVVYGHTPTVDPRWVNNTLCIDTGAVFGGRLTALRYPERELVSVPAAREYYQPARPLQAEAAAPQRDPGVLDMTDVSGRRVIQTGELGRVAVREEHAAGALEVMSRYAMDPRWLLYLPPTMAPASARADGEYLEHPAAAFADYRRAGVSRLICQAKHMGSRAVAVIRRGSSGPGSYGIDGDDAGVVYTRTGRSFFPPELSGTLTARIESAVQTAGIFDELGSDWVALDCELLPWNAKADELIRDEFAAVGAAAGAALAAASNVVGAALARFGSDGNAVDQAALHALSTRLAARAERSTAFTAAYRRYIRATDGLTGVTLAPFAVLAAAGGVLAGRDNAWQMSMADRLVAADPELFTRTQWWSVDADDEASIDAGTKRWLALTAAGGEGIVVKPAAGLTRGPKGLAQPGLKVRGREYLRLIYGPDYTEPENLAALRNRSLGHKRSLALREYALGLESLARAVAGEPLWRVHECVFAVLALESEPVDPRL